MTKKFTPIFLLCYLFLQQPIGAQNLTDPTIANPQVRRAVRESVRKMSEGDQNCLSISLEGFTRRETEASWVRYLKKYNGRTTVRRYLGELFTDNATIKGMSNNNNTLDIYSTVVDKGDNRCELIVWFYLGGKYLSRAEHGDKYHIAADLIYDFADKCAYEMAVAEAKAKQDALRKLELEQLRIQREAQLHQGELNRIQRKLTEQEIRIRDNQMRQQIQLREIEIQKEAISNARRKAETMRYQ
jgi:hypothetical protein